MSEEDEVIFYNYRADRERQIEEELLEDTDPDEYEEPINPNFTGMFPYERGLNAESVFKKKVVENTLGEEIAEKGFTQLRVAESQKKPHVTYFFNGQRELKFEGEERKFIESDKIRAYDERPEMHAEEIAQIVIEALDQEEKNFIMLNFANCDLVGHTGDLEATITAVETVDEQIGRLREKVESIESEGIRDEFEDLKEEFEELSELENELDSQEQDYPKLEEKIQGIEESFEERFEDFFR
ncbi:phosphoglyceromutase [Candidatus Haloredivivus sp. G17]|nr:phosphoglyceromutase [Candidatus Haloredivivus sp. G17]